MKVFSTLLVMILVSPVGIAEGLTRGIIDQGRLLPAPVLKSVQKRIDEIQKIHRTDIYIQTFHKVPIPGMEDLTVVPQEQDRKVAQWSQSFLNDLGDRQMRIVVTEAPAYVIVAVGQQLRENKEFTNDDRNLLIRILTDRFTKSQYGEGMTLGLTYINNVLLGIRPVVKVDKKTPPAGPNLILWVGFSILAICIIWVLTSFLRTFEEPDPTRKRSDQVMENLFGKRLGEYIGSRLFRDAKQT